MTDYSEIRAELEKQLQYLVARAEEIDHDLSEPGDDDWEERATESEGDEVLASVGNLTLNEIADIKRALRQMDQGTYGTCSKCGQNIPKERLEAIPYATTCMQCA